MKNKIKNIALCIMNCALCIVFLASCQKSEGLTEVAPDGKATFNVAVDNGVATRATVNDLTRYIMEVYEVTTTNAPVSGTPQQRYEEATGSFTVILKEGANYACLFWADYGTKDGTSNDYITADLKAVKVASQAKAMAFGGSVRFTYDSKATTKPYLTPTLTHSVAQVNYKQTEDFTAEGNSLTVEFPKTYSLNLDGNVATEIQAESASVKATHSFTSIAKASKDKTIGTSYIIAADATQTVMDITATFNSEVVKTIANVPFQRNYKTNIKGAYSNFYETTLSVTCSDAWEATDKDAVFPPAKVGDYYYSDNTFSTAYDNTKTAIGMIFWINPVDAAKGKIVSLTEEKDKAWGPNNGQTNATSETDGLVNMRTIKALDNTFSAYPAFAVAHALNATTTDYADGSTGVWYLPAKEELMAVYTWWNTNQTANNSKITNAGGTELNQVDYWSATETNSTNSWYVGFSYGYTANYTKTATYNRVRCVRAF